ncbi:fatty acid--CoA ligase [Atopomonas sediminilitoris]|uniref:fatty acid--CoA ligase n=1 Tax=Atopomonas sediminilitoris TaxID=2919919 RepID=UPI001F4E258E|nr:fatty acid--CoA ligase [Atopomonas sediminilitoris]MCJ8169785.1 fatty acid--CoA ligase [Atopomonas sediminilitoris]
MIKTRVLPPAQEAYQYPLLIKRIFESGIRYEAQREISYRGDKRFTYSQFAERVRRLANVLTEAGVKPGDTVAVMDWDSHRYLECMFAIPMIGAVLHTLNVRLSPDQLLYTINHAEDKLVIINDEFLPLFKAIEDKMTTVDSTLLISDAGNTTADLPNFKGEYETLLAAANTAFDFPDFDENSVATTFYTSGTTGNPKGVYFTHRQLVLHTFALCTSCGSFDNNRLFGSNDVYMPITPMFHVHAWGIPYAATLMGIKQVYPGRYEPNLLARLIKTEKVTFSHCVPTILGMLLGADEAKGHDFGGMNIIIGGSALNKSLYKQAKAVGIQLTAAYGMSETGPLISFAYLNDQVLAGSEDEQISFRVKAGMPVPLVETRIIDAEGNSLPHDDKSQGELVLRAPWLTQAYFNEPQKSAELWEGGWLHTGDVAAIDSMGYVDIRDRIKDVIKTGGEWLSSLELEDLISTCEGVREVAVIGLPDPQWGERPYAVIVAKDGANITAQVIKEHLAPSVEAGVINKWGIPTQIAVVTEIPKTSVGKLDKKRIRVDMTSWKEQNSPFLSTL